MYNYFEGVVILIKFSFKYIFTYKKYFFSILFSAFVLYIINFITPYINGKILDSIQSTYLSTSLNFINLIIIFIFLKILELYFNYINQIVLVKYRSKASFLLNNFLLNHLKKVNIMDIKKFNSAYLTERINNDSHLLISFFIDNLFNIFLSFFLFIAITILLFFLNSNIALALFLFFIPLHFISHFIFKNTLKSLNFKVLESQSNFFYNLNLQLENIEAIKIDCSHKQFNKKIINSFNSLLDSIKKYTSINLKIKTFISLNNKFSYLFILLYSNKLIRNNEISIGDFLIIISYFDILINEISLYINTLNRYAETSNCYKRIIEILNIPMENNGKIKLSKISTIKINNFSLFYDNKYIISDLNYEFKSGNIYTLTGDNGKGKSSLIKAIIGLLNKNISGDIYYDNILISDLDIDYFRTNNVSVLNQSFILIDDSIYDNITNYGEINIPNNLKYFCDNLNLSSFLENLPNGLNSLLSKNLSNGQKEKIGILKALIKPYDILILDEPSTGLDIKSVGKISKLLKDISKNKIIIIVTHDKTLMEIADFNLSL